MQKGVNQPLFFKTPLTPVREIIINSPPVRIPEVKGSEKKEMPRTPAIKILVDEIIAPGAASMCL